MGLSLPHKRTLRIYPDMMTVSAGCGGNHLGGGKRGKIEVFSKESRYRLFSMMHKLTFKTVTFLTLTYPLQYPSDPKVYKGHLKEYRRRFEKKYGPVPAVWRLEFQERGAPHFHLMYLDMGFIPVHELCWLWKCVVKSWDMAHELLGVDIKLITSGKEKKLIASYLAKYVGKVDQSEGKNDGSGVGRYWGKWNIEEVSPIILETDDKSAGDIVTRYLAMRGGSETWQPPDPTVCTIFGNKLGGCEFSNRVIEYAMAKHGPFIKRRA